jgi:hypothetical protein
VEGALPRAGRLGHGAPGEPPPRHFASRRLHQPQRIGLHADGHEGTSRWLGIDSNNHDLDPGADPASPVYLMKARLFWPGRATGPALFDSQTRTFPCTAWFLRLLAQGWVDAWRGAAIPRSVSTAGSAPAGATASVMTTPWPHPPLDARIRSVRYAQELRAACLSDHAGLVVELG